MGPTVLAVAGCVVAIADDRGGAAALALTAAERGQYLLLPTAGARADYRAARLAAKRAVVGAIGLARAAGRDGRVEDAGALRRVCARRRPGAGPALSVRDRAGRWCAAGVQLSIAHRDGRGAAAVGPAGGRRVGVDVERAGAVAPAQLRYFAGAAERARGPRDAGALWALKEAAWKALALGADRALGSLALDFGARSEVRAVVVDGRRHPARAALLRPWRRHLVAVIAVEGA